MASPTTKVIGFYRTATSENKPGTRSKEQKNKGTPLANAIPRSSTKIGAQRTPVKSPKHPGNSNTAAILDPFLNLRRERDLIDLDLSPEENNQVPYSLSSESSEIQVIDSDTIIRAPGPEYFSDPSTVINEKSQNNESSSGTHRSSDDRSSLSSDAEIGEARVTPITLSEGPSKRAAYSNSRRSPATRRQQLLKKTKADAEQASRLSDAEPLPNSETSSSTTETDRDQTTTHPSRRLEQIILPKRKSTKKADLSMLRSPRTLMREAKETKAIKKAENVKQAKLHSVRHNLPAGVKLDDDGNLTGTSLITHTPKKCAPTHYFYSKKGRSFQEIFQDVSLTNMGKTLEKKGYELAHQAAIGDLGRHDFEYGSFRSTNDDIARLEQNKRVEKAAEALFDFAGSPNATFVLSSLLHQGVPTMLQLSLINAKGTSLSSHLRAIPKGDSVSDRELAVLKDDGTRQPLLTTGNREQGNFNREIGGMGSCKFKLSRQGDDFKLSIDWDTYYDRQRDLDGNLAEGMPLGVDDVIAVHFETEFIINGAKAHDRQMVLTTEGIRATFSGRLDMSIN